jgi:hypothetical protein
MDTAPRLAKVPLPAGAIDVSDGTTRTHCSAMPSRSATTWAMVVACPCPCEESSWRSARCRRRPS